jgi:DNA-binding CsgD family transcriptional regulator
LQHRDVPTGVRRVFAGFGSVFGLSYVVGITLLLHGGGAVWLVSTHAALGFAMTAVLVAVFISLVTCSRRELTRDQIRSVRLLGWCLLTGHVVLAGSAALPYAAHMLSLAGALLWLNCVPILWLHNGFDLYHRACAAEGEGGSIARLAQEYGITQREREVMELIVRGKSNREIEEELFVSFSTVKNHAYNLYRKLGVKSRAQLIHLVMASTSRPADAARGDGRLEGGDPRELDSAD